MRLVETSRGQHALVWCACCRTLAGVVHWQLVPAGSDSAAKISLSCHSCCLQVKQQSKLVWAFIVRQGGGGTCQVS